MYRWIRFGLQPARDLERMRHKSDSRKYRAAVTARQALKPLTASLASFPRRRMVRACHAPLARSWYAWMVTAIARAVHGSQPSHDSGLSIRPTTSPPSKRKTDKRLSLSLVGLRCSVAAAHLKSQCAMLFSSLVLFQARHQTFPAAIVAFNGPV